MRVEVRFEVEIPEINGVTPNDDQIEEWLRYELGDNGCMELKNPLSQMEVEPVFGTFVWAEAY